MAHTIEVRRVTATALCDFCSTGALATRAYPCADHKTVLMSGQVEVVMSGPWSACDRCAAFIDAGDRSGLLAAGHATIPPADTVRRARRAACHAGFFAHRLLSGTA